MAAPDLVDLLESFLDGKKLLAKKNQAGLMVLPAEGGAFVCGVDETGHYRSFDVDELKFLKKWDLHLDASLAKNGETVRRADMLTQRQSQPGLTAWESLDTRPGKTTMPAVGSARGDVAKNLPRIYAALDLSDKKQAQIVLFASEFGVDSPVAGGAKTRRLDEAVLKFDVDDTVAQKIASGQMTIKDAMATVRAKNAQVVYYDNNRELVGRARVEHNIKTIDTLQAWFEALPARFSIKFSGAVQIACVDILESAIGVQVEDRAKPGATDAERLAASEKRPQRRSAEKSLPKPGSQAQETILLGTFDVAVSDTGPGTVTRVQSQGFQRFKKAFTAADAAEIEHRFLKFMSAAEGVLKKMV